MLFPMPVFTEGFLIDALNYVEKVTYGGFGIMIMIVIFSVLFLMMNNYGSEKALTASSFITSFCGVLFRFLFMKNDYVVYVSIILFAIFLFSLKASNDSI